MIRSMTGFGDASQQVGTLHLGVELRSLNNRYFKATIRLPEPIAGLEAELEAMLRKHVVRGSLVLTVKMRLADTAAGHRVNDQALVDYLRHLEAIHAKFDAAERSLNIDLTALLALPGVLQPNLDDEQLLATARPALLQLTKQAVEKMDQMRLSEGKACGEQLLVYRRGILDRLAAIQQRAPGVVEEYHQRLRTRVDQLIARAELKVAEVDLIKEIAIFAERADISEELTRLAGHLDQFQRIIAADQGDAAGRTLDFIAQEMLREANTIGSKSNDAAISRAIVEVKAAIDRIKEQVQNVE